MLMLSACEAVWLVLSVTVAVKLAVPAVVGVPLDCPEALSVSPAGSDPDVMLQVFPPLPPLATRVCEYEAPTVPGASDVVVTVSVAGWMLILSGCEAVWLVLSVTVAVKLAVPAVVGVPVIVPDALSASPAGSYRRSRSRYSRPATACKQGLRVRSADRPRRE